MKEGEDMDNVKINYTDKVFCNKDSSFFKDAWPLQ